MHYTIQQLATLANISTRTLRYYDTIGILKPAKTTDAGYRLYTAAEVDNLQQILFYKELEFSLDEIKKIIYDPSFDKEIAMQNHLECLHQKQNRLTTLIKTAESTLNSLKGSNKMTDNEKFKGFKEDLINNNEAQFGNEIRAKYGERTVDLANAKKLNMTEQEYTQFLNIENELNETLAKAINTGEPGSKLAQKAAALHKEWLEYSLPEYNPEIHLSLAEMYTADQRFADYYEKIAPGCADFLQKAIMIYLS